SIDLDVATTSPLDDPQPMTSPPDIVRLAGDHLTPRLPRGGPQALSLTLDPRQAPRECQADLLVSQPPRSRNPDPTCWWIDTDVEVLDVLVDDIDADARNGEMGATGTHRGLSAARKARPGDQSRQAKCP